MGSSASGDSRAPGQDETEQVVSPHDRTIPLAEKSSIGEIVEHLQCHPDQCWQALEGLTLVEPEARSSIIEALSCHHARPGVSTLLRLLCTARDPGVRAAARFALGHRNAPADTRPSSGAPEGPARSGNDVALLLRARGSTGTLFEETTGPLDRRDVRLASCLVTPVDGRGLGSIVVSVHRMAQRRTAAFLCDVQLGIRDVMGEVEPESPRPASLIEELVHESGGNCVRDVPALALGLLAGSLMLCEATVPAEVRDWLDGTLGPGFAPAAFPASVPGLDSGSIPDEELTGRARAVLEACPSWLDTSPLTFELAEEICLREVELAVDPGRDAGAYRFLFEHRLIHRLEMYRRMLLWMAWLWRFSGHLELAQSAATFARQLLDDQYAVPSHPFTLALTTRSMEAAQERLRCRGDPRGPRD